MIDVSTVSFLQCTDAVGRVTGNLLVRAQMFSSEEPGPIWSEPMKNASSTETERMHVHTLRQSPNGLLLESPQSRSHLSLQQHFPPVAVNCDL